MSLSVELTHLGIVGDFGLCLRCFRNFRFSRDFNRTDEWVVIDILYSDPAVSLAFLSFHFMIGKMRPVVNVL